MQEPKRLKKLPASFFRTKAGNEPVREWLKKLSAADRHVVGADIATVEYGWPLGMPACRSISSRKGLWEIRSNVSAGRIARILFFIHKRRLILLHGFIKKTQQTPDADLELAVQRQKEVANG